MGRRISLLLVMMTVVLVLSSGVALAGYFVGTRGDDRLIGKAQADEMYGLKGDDRIEGRANDDYIEGGANNDRLFGDADDDEIYGGKGADNVFGGEGDDYINVADNGRVDEVDCGENTGDDDTVVFDIGPLAAEIDVIDANCENQQPVVVP